MQVIRRKVVWGAMVLGVVIVVLVAAWAAGCTKGMRTVVVQRLAQLILPLVYDEHTTYAAGYSEKTFRSLKLGMSEKTVRATLGQPLSQRTLSDGRTILYYSEQATPLDNYLVRNLVFDFQGRLAERHTEFYID